MPSDPATTGRTRTHGWAYPHGLLSISSSWWRLLLMSMAPVLGSDHGGLRKRVGYKRQRAPPILMNEDYWGSPWKFTDHSPSRKFKGRDEGIKCKKFYDLMVKLTDHPLLLPLGRMYVKILPWIQDWISGIKLKIVVVRVFFFELVLAQDIEVFVVCGRLGWLENPVSLRRKVFWLTVFLT